MGNEEMTRSKAIALAVFTLWPILYMVLFMCVIIGFMLFTVIFDGQPSTPPASGAPMIFMIIVPLHILTIVEVWVLLVFYIIHVFKTDRVSQDKKALWAVVLFLGNMIAMPIYWYLYIWREPEQHTIEPAATRDD